MRTVHGSRSGILLTLAVCGAAAIAGCGDTEEPVTAEAYLGSLEAICIDTTAELQMLPAPPEQISVTDFATRAAELLDGEAARVDRLDVPDDATLRGDHRAFVRNTEEQADAWRSIAGGGSADLVTSADLVRQLVLGRNDLAEEMGAPACRREG
ncbi:MAG: hypothetical protein WBL31_03395 [Ilumatobacteraceae bacterium]|jgi:hypothetical protein